MKKRFVYIGLILLALLLFIRFSENPSEQIGTAVAIAADGILEKDGGVSEQYQYIAIDLTNVQGLVEEDGNQIVRYFEEKYDRDCLLASLDDLKELGLYDLGLPDGVLVRFDKFSTTLLKNVKFEGSKFVSPKGGVGVKGKLHHKNGEWQVKNTRITFES